MAHTNFYGGEIVWVEISVARINPRYENNYDGYKIIVAHNNRTI